MHKLTKISNFILTVSIVTTVFAADSTHIQNQHALNKVMQYRSYVNTNDCMQFKSDRFLIVLGNGYGNMEIKCPDHHPVFYQWNMESIYMGGPAVVGGGGRTSAVCCAVAHRWEV